MSFVFRLMSDKIRMPGGSCSFVFNFSPYADLSLATVIHSLSQFFLFNAVEGTYSLCMRVVWSAEVSTGLLPLNTMRQALASRS
jgi:hypothetical protein